MTPSSLHITFLLDCIPNVHSVVVGMSDSSASMSLEYDKSNERLRCEHDVSNEGRMG